MIFIDSGAILARYLPNDQYHQDAIPLWRQIEAEGRGCLTSNFVLDETFTLLGRRSSFRFASETARVIYESERFQILRPTLEDELAAIKMFEKYADQKVSFTDCISFVLMRKAGLNTVFSFDRHFARAGFKLWS